EGFVPITTPHFDGLIHWRGDRSASTLRLHAPGRSIESMPAQGLMIDLPGHGLSSRWRGAAPTDWTAVKVVIDAVCAAFGGAPVAMPELPQGDPGRLFPDLQPDR